LIKIKKSIHVNEKKSHLGVEIVIKMKYTTVEREDTYYANSIQF
jgi:hypothetical protein